MVPSSRWEDIEDDDGRSSGSEQDDVFDEDMEALKRACMITGRIPGEIEESDADSAEDSSDTDDLDLLRSIQDRFAIPSSAADSVPFFKPLNTILPSDSDGEDDFETLHAIQRRFEQYKDEKDTRDVELVTTGVTSGQGVSETSLGKRIYQDLGQETQYPVDGIEASELPSTSASLHDELDYSTQLHHAEDGTFRFPATPSQFPKSCQMLVDALKKNRSCQKFIRNKMIQIEAKIEENKDLKERIKCIMDLQVACKRRAGRLLNQKKDPRVRLISLPKSRISRKANSKKTSYSGPRENSHVSKYKMVMRTLPVSLSKQPWSKSDKEKLAKGIKQQYQEMHLLNSMEIESDQEGSYEASYALSLSSLGDYYVTSEDFRSFLPLVNWERLASMYFSSRTGVECQSRWLNCEDPVINNNPWTPAEDKSILYIAQNNGVFNWIDIAVKLGTQRTPFQCLVRYQRSLNAYILKKEWTEDEDTQLRAAVETFGEDWQVVASNLEGRTGPQCSNRWRKTLHPDRKRVGRWSIEEDKRLKVAVMLFGAKNWNKIAQFAPGRTQVQCRERWVNCLDPSLNLDAWTEEEDSKLKAAIAEFGHCWSKVATFVPPRTDSQCRRRWKVLLPGQVPLLQAARKMQKVALISNFVDREKERPLIGPGDFCPMEGEHSSVGVSKTDKKKANRKRKKISSDVDPSIPSKKCKAKAAASKGNSAGCDHVEPCVDKTVSEKEKKIRRKLQQKRSKGVKSTENSDAGLHSEPTMPGITDIEHTGLDDVPKLDDIPQSDALESNSYTGSGTSISSDNALLGSALHNRTMVSLVTPEIAGQTEQAAGKCGKKRLSKLNRDKNNAVQEENVFPVDSSNVTKNGRKKRCKKDDHVHSSQMCSGHVFLPNQENLISEAVPPSGDTLNGTGWSSELPPALPLRKMKQQLRQGVKNYLNSSSIADCT